MLLIKKYTKSMSNQWDNFIRNSNNGTIFHYRDFLNYHIKRNFEDHSLCFFDNNNLICAIPATLKNNHLISHPGASYGGLIIDSSVKFSIMSEIIKLLDKYCIDNKIKSFFLIPSPNIYWARYDASLEYLLEYNNYYSKEIYISHAAKLNQEKKIIHYIDKRKKRYINRLLKNEKMQILKIDDWDNSFTNDFYQILVHNKKRYATQPTHSLDELKKLKLLFKDEIELFITIKQNEVLGGCVLFITNNCTSLVFYNAIKEEVKNLQLASLQLYFCADYSEKLNLKYIDFGVSQQPETSNPLSPKKSLINFKEKFNSLGVWRRAYNKDFYEKK
tara:strand:- start:966 stop:1958 length:993 start_codon:yes stop_codon:yes gene_type:complete